MSTSLTSSQNAPVVPDKIVLQNDNNPVTMVANVINGAANAMTQTTDESAVAPVPLTQTLGNAVAGVTSAFGNDQTIPPLFPSVILQPPAVTVPLTPAANIPETLAPIQQAYKNSKILKLYKFDGSNTTNTGAVTCTLGDMSCDGMALGNAYKFLPNPLVPRN